MKNFRAPRIITGTSKGTKLKVPTSARPITDRIKTVVFDMLGELVEGREVLDLFAGSGTMGLEALSRGASSATFVEASSEARDVIKQNIAACGFGREAKIIMQRTNAFLNKDDQKYSLIFIDPPFADVPKFDLGRLVEKLSPAGLIVFRAPKVILRLPDELELIQEKTIGSSSIWFIKLTDQVNPAL